MGPLKGIYRENGKWEFPKYLNVKKIFEKRKNVQRESIYNTFVKSICKKQRKSLMIYFKRFLLLSQAKMRCIKFKEILYVRINLQLTQRN